MSKLTIVEKELEAVSKLEAQFEEVRELYEKGVLTYENCKQEIYDDSKDIAEQYKEDVMLFEKLRDMQFDFLQSLLHG